MRRVDVAVVNAFVDAGGGGNPAGVVLEGDAWSAAERQAIAAELGFPETAFVLKSSTEDFRLVFHTPTRTIPHCGHATVAAVALMAEEGRLAPGVWRNETVDGPRRVRVEGGRVDLEQVRPTLRDLSPTQDARLLRGVGIAVEDLWSRRRPRLASNGNQCLLVPVAEASRLASLRPDQTSLESLSQELDVVGVYVFAPAGEPGLQATARMFAPAYGIPEEAATGMMAGPAGHWLSAVEGVQGAPIRIAQGRFMEPPSPSLLEVNLERDHLWVGGSARVMERRRIELSGAAGPGQGASR